MAHLKNLGSFEELALLSILRLGDQAYGVKIRQQLEESTGKPVSIGAVYATLERLEGKGYVSSRQRPPTRERGGRRKRHFKLEGSGVEALNSMRHARARLMKGVKLSWEVS